MPALSPTEATVCDVVPQKPIGDGRSYWCHTHGCTALPVCLRQIGAAPGQRRYQDWPGLYPEALDQAVAMAADIPDHATDVTLSHAAAAVTAAAHYRQTDIPDEAADLHHHASRCAAALLVINPPATATDRWNRIAEQAAAMLAAHIGTPPLTTPLTEATTVR